MYTGDNILRCIQSVIAMKYLRSAACWFSYKLLVLHVFCQHLSLLRIQTSTTRVRCVRSAETHINASWQLGDWVNVARGSAATSINDVVCCPPFVCLFVYLSAALLKTSQWIIPVFSMVGFRKRNVLTLRKHYLLAAGRGAALVLYGLC